METVIHKKWGISMNYRFNREIAALQPSASIALMDKARAMKAQGMDVISLAGGEPDFDTPEVAAQAGIRGILRGKTHYTAGRGIPTLRERLAKKLRDENGICCGASSVLVTPGAKAAIYCAVRTLVNPGDEVMILDPSWVSYESIVQAASATAVHVPLSFADGYTISREVLESCVSEKSRILIINTPNNPTGRVITEKEAKVIADFAMQYDLMVIADEIYEKILFDGSKHISLASNPEIAERVVTVNGLSKCAAMTGWRLGYLTAAQEVVDQIYLFYQHVFTCVPEFAQEAAVREVLESCVSEKSRILIINTPNNPTGRVITEKEAKVIADFAMQYDLMVIADEIYEKILFDGSKHISLASNPEIAERVVTVNGLSKCAAMTGWRLGYLTAAQEVVDQIYLFYQHVFTCVPEFAQEAAVAALDATEAVEAMRVSYQQRRDSFIADLQALPGFSCIVPEGAFYAWARVDYHGMDADAVAKFLLEEAHVVTVPGGAYGENSKNCIRMCFAADSAELKEAVKRMAAVLKEEKS